MRIARWLTATGATVDGLVCDSMAVPFGDGTTVESLLAEGLVAAIERFGQVTTASPGAQPVESVTLLAPLRPATIRDFVAFEEHVEGVSAGVEGKKDVAPEWYEAPTFYFTNPHTVRGTGEVVAIPHTQRLDFELELAAVVGAVRGVTATNLDPAAAEAHIFGYTILNDWSARDLQAREMKVRLGPSKGKDFANTLGPWIVTADELAPFRDDDGFLAVRAEVYVNGSLIGADLVSNMGWPFAELLSYASANSLLCPGDVLGSGTVGNGGCLGELWGLGRNIAPLEPGDEVRMSIEGVGEIVNVVGDRVQAPPVQRARPRPRTRFRT